MDRKHGQDSMNKTMVNRTVESRIQARNP